MVEFPKNGELNFHIVQPGDSEMIACIANWYLQEWKIPVEKTVQKLAAVTESETQFQAVLLENGRPIATGGIYHHVGLLDKEPRFKIHPHWLALVYTVPEKRGQGLGAQLCAFIEKQALLKNFSQVYLFTDTAEALYSRLGWKPLERLALSERNVVVMVKDITGRNDGSPALN